MLTDISIKFLFFKISSFFGLFESEVIDWFIHWILNPISSLFFIHFHQFLIKIFFPILKHYLSLTPSHLLLLSHLPLPLRLLFQLI